MKKKIALVSVSIAILLSIIYVGLVGIDCHRLTQSKPGTKPLICVSEEIEAYEQKYYGLGYYIRYYEDAIPQGDDVMLIMGEGVEIYWLGIRVWNLAW